MASMEVIEEGIVSFRWRLREGWLSIKESIASSEYRCPNGHQWRGLLIYKGGKLSVYVQLISAVTSVLVEGR